MESRLKKFVFFVVVICCLVRYAEDSTTRVSLLLSKDNCIWLSTKVKGPRHKRFFLKPLPPSCLSVDSSHSGGLTLLLLLLSGDIEVNPGPDTCPICNDLIQEARGNKKGQDAIFCDGSCQAWIHRRCASLNKCTFEKLAESSTEFFCPTCRLTTLEALVQDLQKQLRALQETTPKPAIAEPRSSCTQHEFQNQQNDTARRYDMNQHPIPFSPTVQRSRADRKFNLIVYGIKEHPKGTRKHLRSVNDTTAVISILKSIHSSVTEFSIRDCFRLGKYSELRHRPLLVTLSRSNDVLSILANRRQLSQQPHISIKPDLTPEARKTESILLKQRRELISAGTNPRDIRIRNDTLFCNGKKYGVVVNSTFNHYTLASGTNRPSSSQSNIQSSTQPSTSHNPSPSAQFLPVQPSHPGSITPLPHNPSAVTTVSSTHC